MKSNYSEKKFNEKLEKSSKLFAMLGLVLALFIVHVFMEYETKKVKDKIDFDVRMDETVPDYISEVFQKEEVKKVVVKKEEVELKKEIKILDEIKVIDDDVKDLIESPIEEEDEVFDIEAVSETNIVAPIEEDVDFIRIEEAPVFPGCKGTKKELKACFAKKMKKHVNRKFNKGLSETLGLSPGIKRIYVEFKIDKTGKIIDIRSRAPHPRLEKEAKRIIELLPIMIPGKQRHRPVGVKYGMPIVFKVE